MLRYSSSNSLQFHRRYPGKLTNARWGMCNLFVIVCFSTSAFKHWGKIVAFVILGGEQIHDGVVICSQRVSDSSLKEWANIKKLRLLEPFFQSLPLLARAYLHNKMHAKNCWAWNKDSIRLESKTTRFSNKPRTDFFPSLTPLGAHKSRYEAQVACLC